MDKNNLLWAEEYNLLLTQLLDDILDTKLSPSDREEYLFHRIAKKDPSVKSRLVAYEVDQYKTSDQFLKFIEESVDKRLEEKVQERFDQ